MGYLQACCMGKRRRGQEVDVGEKGGAAARFANSGHCMSSVSLSTSSKHK
jgi:hypothetical protein